MRAHEILRVAAASTEDARWLKVKVGTPIAIRDRISFDQTGSPWEVLHSRDVNFEYRYVILNDVTAVPRHEK
jgi:DNA-binding GntR family transcriptional regulator